MPISLGSMKIQSLCLEHYLARGGFSSTRLIHLHEIWCLNLRHVSYLLSCSVMLYSSQESATSSVPRDANIYQPFRVADVAILDKIKEEFSSASAVSDQRKDFICTALRLGLRIGSKLNVVRIN